MEWRSERVDRSTARSEHTSLHVQAIMLMMCACSGYSGEDSGLGGYRVSTLDNGEDVGA